MAKYGPYPRRHSSERWKALQWFYDHDYDLFPRPIPPPTKRMRTTMLRAGQLEWDDGRLMLTEKGLHDLATKGERRNFLIERKPDTPTEPRRRRRKSPRRSGGRGRSIEA